jgi:hypothetical protein
MSKSYKVVSKLKAKKKEFPLSSKKYSKANSEADVIEKKQHPRGYKSLKRVDKGLKKGEILGHVSKKGDLYVSKKVPKHLRKEVAEHDKNERRIILSSKNKKT